MLAQTANVNVEDVSVWPLTWPTGLNERVSSDYHAKAVEEHLDQSLLDWG